jgi:hypothetical protein
MRTSKLLIILCLCFFVSVRPATSSQPETTAKSESFLIHYWFFDSSLPNNQPLQLINPAYGLIDGGWLEYKSALAGYPFNPFNPFWLKASLQRRSAPTPINYQPIGNNNIPFDESNMQGIQVKQPFTGDGGENTLIFHLPATGFKELVFRFAAKDQDAADALIIDYAVEEGESDWISTGMSTTLFTLEENYTLYEVNFTDSATQSPPPPPGHGLGDDQISAGTYLLVNDNPHFKIRIRFTGDNMGTDLGKVVVFNNFSLEGTPATEAYQVIPLRQGWSGISSFVNPDNAAMEHIFLPAGQSLIIAQNFDGLYWPVEGINSLGNWSSQSGYAVKSLIEKQILINGETLENPGVDLPAGWSFLPVPRNCFYPPDDLFQTIINQLVIVKEIAGTGVYWPALGIDNLQVVEPGKAYFILMDGTATLPFPDCSDHTGGGFQNLPDDPKLSNKTTYLSPVSKTIFTHTIAIPSFTAKTLKSGDILSAYDADGNCFGSVVWESESTTLTLYGNDATTIEKDGFNEHEPYKLRLNRPETGETFSLEATYDPLLPNSIGLFAVNGLSAMTDVELKPAGYSLSLFDANVHIIPNPAYDHFVISVNDMQFAHATLTIFRLDGTLVKEMVISQNPTTIFVQDFSSGVYVLQIEVNGVKVNRRLIKY